jgi:hypothetical protein
VEENACARKISSWRTWSPEDRLCWSTREALHYQWTTFPQYWAVANGKEVGSEHAINGKVKEKGGGRVLVYEAELHEGSGDLRGRPWSCDFRG